MFNSIFFALSTFLILVSYNIILLNEETLILICFVFFIWIILNRFNQFAMNYLVEYSLTIETTIKESLIQVLNSLEKVIGLHLKFRSLITAFNNLKFHFSRLLFLILKYLPIFHKKKQFFLYPKRFLFTKHVEKQAIKLLTLLISRKLNKIALMKQFYSRGFNITYFSCFQKISLREYLTKIN